MLIIIGAMKCGTTSLHRYLGHHPDICVSNPKDLGFFLAERNWNKGYEWYRSHFDDTKPVWVEASTNCSKFPLFQGVPQRMHAVFPDATLVYLVRDPIERLVSHYLHNLAHGRETRPFEAALAEFARNKYVNVSRYHFQIQQFRQYYGPSRILLFELHELSESPVGVVRAICDQVGLTYDYDTAGLDVVHNATGEKRLPQGGPWAGRTLTRPVISSELRRRLCEALRPDTDRLRHYWGRDLSHWYQADLL